MNKKSKVARSKPRDSKGRFIKYEKTANSNAVMMPEDNYINSSPVVTPLAEGVFHVNTFRTIAGSAQGMYRNLDEALRTCTVTAKAMLNDVSLTSPLFQRWMSLASYNDCCIPSDENDEKAVAVCEEIMNDLNSIPKWTEFKKNLMWASWYGKHVNVMDWQFDYENNIKKLKAKGWQPIIGDKLVFRNNGRMGYFCNQPTGYREVVYSDRGQAEMFDDDDYDCLVHHKYFITDTTWDEGMLAIGVEGFGYRHWLYWTYWLKQQLLEWALNAFQIFGAGGIRIAYFEQSNDESQQQVADAMVAANGENIILFPRPIGEEKQGAGLEIVEPRGIGLDAFQAFIDDYFGKQINQMLLGFDFDDEREDYYLLQKYDADGLSETITRDLVSVLIKYNYPEAADYGIKYQINVPVNDTEKYLTSVQRAYEIGLELSETEVYAALGFTKPTKNKRKLVKPKEEFANTNTIKTPDRLVGNLGDQLS